MGNAKRRPLGSGRRYLRRPAVDGTRPFRVLKRPGAGEPRPPRAYRRGKEPTMLVKEVMTPKVEWVDPEVSVKESAFKMRELNVGCPPAGVRPQRSFGRDALDQGRLDPLLARDLRRPTGGRGQAPSLSENSIQPSSGGASGAARSLFERRGLGAGAGALRPRRRARARGRRRRRDL